jgi:hypothetical protein
MKKLRFNLEQQKLIMQANKEEEDLEIELNMKLQAVGFNVQAPIRSYRDPFNGDIVFTQKDKQ